MKSLQEQWKQSPRASKEDEDILWTQFKRASDRLYENAQRDYEDRKRKQVEAKIYKESLVRQAESLSYSNDFKSAKSQMKSLQEQWKQSPRAAKEDEDRLWTQFTYDYNGCIVYFRYWCYEDKIEKSIDNSYGVGDSHQISYINYFFITEFGNGEKLTDYYEDSDDNHKYLSIDISKHYEECQYYVPGIGSMSRDDVILVAYLLESVSHNPGENPFCFINADDYQTNNDVSGMNYELP